MSLPDVAGGVSDDTQDFPYPLAYRYPMEDADVAVRDAARRLTVRAIPKRLRSRAGEQAGADQFAPGVEGADRMAVSVKDYEPLVNLWNVPTARQSLASVRTVAVRFKAAAMRLALFELLVSALIVLASFSLAHARGVGFLTQTRVVADRLSIGLGPYLVLGSAALAILAILYAVERIQRSPAHGGRPEERDGVEVPEEYVGTVDNSVMLAVRERKLSLARSSQVVRAFTVRQKYGRRLRLDAALRDASGYLVGALVLLGAPLTIIGLVVPVGNDAFVRVGTLGEAGGASTGEVGWHFPNAGIVLAVLTLLGMGGLLLAVVESLAPRLRSDVEIAERRLGAAYLVSSDAELAEGINSSGARTTLHELQEAAGWRSDARQNRLAHWFSSQTPLQLILWATSTVVLIVALAVTVRATGLPIGPAIAVAALLVGLSSGLVATIRIAVDNRALRHADAICHCSTRRALDPWALWPCLFFVALGWAILPTALVIGAEDGGFAILVCVLHLAIFLGLVFGTGVIRYDRAFRSIACVRYHTYDELKNRLEESVAVLADLDAHASRRRRPQVQQRPQSTQQQVARTEYGYATTVRRH